ncbi:hypothetical protein ERO13_D02G175450v2 [Gossypium hirsutum]|uniref:OBG-type G domain-containing protein n=1 Tax=Gossypium darwinii TaxID=34276 RepID=A0A5D2DFK7_GOSDA|nr:hypothetical protein ERO13_D02G175450v2 [Gossypium hirsutum]TYG80457.1 hypothetical protein ES288_D02G217600v1 [Gossypium darwinii]
MTSNLKIEHELCERIKAWLADEKDVRLGDWKLADIEILNTFQLLSAKPVVYLVNMTEKDYQRKKNKFLPKIHAWYILFLCVCVCVLEVGVRIMP